MEMPENIFEEALKIGFTVGKYRGEINHISLPCMVKTKDNQSFEYCQLFYLESPHLAPAYILRNTTSDISGIDSIEASPFAMPLEMRLLSTDPEEYRNDSPFFIRLKNGELLGYNATVPVDYISFDKKYKTEDVLERVLWFSEERIDTKPYRIINHTDTTHLHIITFGLTKDQTIRLISKSQY